jgi:vacuolar-type H+-ATPase subunit H
MAVQEAREQAARILAGAEQQAQSLIGDSEDRARRTHDEALSAIRSELAALESSRQRAQAEIDAMHRWIDDHRVHLTASLKDALSAVERAGAVSPPPSSTPLDIPRPLSAPVQQAAQVAPQPGPAVTAAPQPGPAATAAPQPGPAATAAPQPVAPAPAEESVDNGPETMAWKPGPAFSEPTGEVAAVPQGRRPVIDVDGPARSEESIDAEEQALDDFFEDGEYVDDRRFGGRLRRRR